VAIGASQLALLEFSHHRAPGIAASSQEAHHLPLCSALNMVELEYHRVWVIAVNTGVHRQVLPQPPHPATPARPPNTAIALNVRLAIQPVVCPPIGAVKHSPHTEWRRPAALSREWNCSSGLPTRHHPQTLRPAVTPASATRSLVPMEGIVAA